MRALLTAVILCLPLPAAAQDVIVIGEVHDNPAHHQFQADKVTGIAPAALVFEMLTAEQAVHANSDLRGDRAALERALNWVGSGWPDFSYYHPILTAAPGARVYGAGLDRKMARKAMGGRFAQVLGEDADRYGLREALPKDQQDTREALQMAAHCDALPQSALPGIVMAQRLRDAMLAQAVVTAHEDTGGPVVVITGNGHARRDWGMPAVLARVAPELELHVIGQTEDDAAIEGGFDEVVSAPAAERDNPCEAFQ